MNLESINDMSTADFLEAFGGIFEHSPWVAERASSQRPFTTIATMHEAMTAVVAAASLEQQWELICAHPDLGARAKMSSTSTLEQAGAGLDRLTAAEFQRLHQLNGAYSEKFQFPFICAVRGMNTSEILLAIEQRLANTVNQERQTALTQIYKIAHLRLKDAIDE